MGWPGKWGSSGESHSASVSVCSDAIYTLDLDKVVQRRLRFRATRGNFPFGRCTPAKLIRAFSLFCSTAFPRPSRTDRQRVKERDFRESLRVLTRDLRSRECQPVSTREDDPKMPSVPQ